VDGEESGGDRERERKRERERGGEGRKEKRNAVGEQLQTAHGRG